MTSSNADIIERSSHIAAIVIAILSVGGGLWGLAILPLSSEVHRLAIEQKEMTRDLRSDIKDNINDLKAQLNQRIAELNHLLDILQNQNQRSFNDNKERYERQNERQNK